MTTFDLDGLDAFEWAVKETDDEITCVYCADLLSWAMGRAPESSAWCTVMGNVNAVAVASLADVAVLVLCEGAPLDDEAAQRARQQKINIVKTALPAFDAAYAIAKHGGLLDN